MTINFSYVLKKSVMFDGASNVQLSGELLKIHYPKVSVMRGVEHTVSLFFNDVSKIPVLNHTITYHKAIYNLFGSVIYHKPHSIFKSKSYNFTIVTLVYSVARSDFLVHKSLCIPMK